MLFKKKSILHKENPLGIKSKSQIVLICWVIIGVSADTWLLLCLGRALRSVYLINVICTVTTLIYFHSAAQWTQRPYLA